MNRTALAKELEQLHEAGFYWALSCCRWDRDEAEEVMQMSYLKVIDGRAGFAGESTLKTWFFGVIRKTALEHSRRRWLSRLSLKKLALLAGPEAAGEATANPADVMQGAEMKQRLRRALLQLPGRQREMLDLVFYQDLTIREAADVLGITVGSARVHYERGKRQLHNRLETEKA